MSLGHYDPLSADCSNDYYQSYKSKNFRIQQCALINQHLRELAVKFPYTKFLKAIAQTCIPNFPERNLPSLFVYFEGEMKQQFVGSHELRGTSLTCDGKL